jgi:predicted HD superfamily hydrolase involved in NAD metabolism
MVYTEISNESIIKWLKDNLNEERYLHSLGTADCARQLAKKFGENEDKAYIAGLLHDAAKCFPKENLLEIIDNNLDIEEWERLNYKTLHAPVSAYVAQNTFKVKDEEILSSIRWHTLGKLDMTTFEKIIFLADKIEPNTRDKSYSEKIYKLLDEEKGLDKALLECYKATIKSLVERDLKICLLTIEIYNKLEEIILT